MNPSFRASQLKKTLIFPQNRFDNINRRYKTCCSGQKLFGMTVMEHPRVEQVERELKLLNKLYRYVRVKWLSSTFFISQKYF